MSARLLVLLALALTAAACRTPTADPAAALVPEADVARVQMHAFVETQGVDAEIARVEAEAEAADSLRQLAYTPVLERLRQDRRRLQVRVDSLAPMPRPAFDEATAGIAAQLAALRAGVARARFDAATDAASLAAATAQRLGRFDARLAAARPAAAADTTGRLGASLDTLSAQRGRLSARIDAFADTTASGFARLRLTAVREAQRLDARLGQVAPDTTAAPRPASGQ